METGVSKAEMRAVTSAINARWNIKQEYRDAMIQRVMRIIVDGGSTTREVCAAMKLMIAAEAQNQSDERNDAPINLAGGSILEVAGKLGLGNLTAAISTDAADSNTASDVGGSE